MNIKNKTHSLWSFLLENQHKYLNPLYDPNLPCVHEVIEPNTVAFNFKFWRSMYHQFDKTIHPRQSQLELVLSLSEQNKQLEIEAKQLEKKIIELGEKPRTVIKKESFHLVSRLSQTLKATDKMCKERQSTPGTNPIRTVEGSNIPEDGCKDLKPSFSKAEPTLVNLELGMAKMTC